MNDEIDQFLDELRRQQPKPSRPCAHHELPAAQPGHHSITSVTWSMISLGNVMPRAWAVFRFTTKSKVIGCSTGRSAGLVPLRIRSTWVAARWYSSSKLMPYAI